MGSSSNSKSAYYKTNYLRKAAITRMSLYACLCYCVLIPRNGRFEKGGLLTSMLGLSEKTRYSDSNKFNL